MGCHHDYKTLTVDDEFVLGLLSIDGVSTTSLYFLSFEIYDCTSASQKNYQLVGGHRSPFVLGQVTAKVAQKYSSRLSEDLPSYSF